MGGDFVTFGFTELASGEKSSDSAVATPRSSRTPDLDAKQKTLPPQKNAGLGNGPGGQIARSFLSEKGGLIVESLPNSRNHGQRGGWRFSLSNAHHSEIVRPDAVSGSSSDLPESLSAGPEPQGMFLALLLNDMERVTEQDLQGIRKHRWTFHGAASFAAQGRSFCHFVRCLLDLQRNVQLEEEGEALDSKLANACKTFVSAQCRLSNMGGMYQLLSHFISNSLIFYEWGQFLKTAFEDQRASQESFLVPHLEQVWGRYCRFSAVIETIFDVLNSRYVWRHRLPKVSDLINDHMRRRCFSHETIIRNELFSQTSCRNETIKQVKYTFGLT